MWVIRFLNGPLTGQMLNLKPGKNLVGRNNQCDIPIIHPGVSKQHCIIHMSETGVQVEDLNSSNGTFVNGLKVKTHKLSHADKISCYDIMAEVLNVSDVNAGFKAPSFNPVGVFGNVAMKQNPELNTPYQPGEYHQPDEVRDSSASPQHSESPQRIPKGLQGFLNLAQNYLDEVVLPGIYKLAEWTEFRWVLLIFMGLFIVFVTSLSSIPLINILKTSIEKESQRRALTIARTLAKMNQVELMNGREANVSTELANREPGVAKSYIFSNVDNLIIAPASLSGKYPADKFVHSARKEGRESVTQIDSSTIGALVPIEYYNPQTGSQSVMAYAVVVYDMGTLAVDDGQTLSLFIQTFIIALIVGTILFYFLYKLVEYPYSILNKQLDLALKEGGQQIQLSYQFPAAQELVSNIGSALSRIHGVGPSSEEIFEADRSQEMSNLIQLIGFPAMAISADDKIISALNESFEEKVGIQNRDLLYGSVSSINDQSLKLSLEDLIERVIQNPEQMATNELEFSGTKHEIVAQAINGNKNIAYILFVILPAEGGAT